MGILSKDIFDQLIAEHREVEELFDRCLSATDEDERLDLQDEIQMELISHARAEEKTLYSALYERVGEEKSSDAGQVKEAYEEHAIVDHLMKEWKSLDANDELWVAKAKVLMENVKHHVKEEENQLFKVARRLLDFEEKEQLLAQYQTERERFMETLPTQAQIRSRQQAPSNRNLHS